VTEFLPSELRHRLTLEQIQREEDEGGGYAETWTEVAVLACDLRPFGGGEGVEADRLAGRLTHAVALRYRPGVTPAMRFRKGARVFHILAVINVDERNRWLKCLCEERDL
jgi:SPP1 family predicted phage head-tail adaptor